MSLSHEHTLWLLAIKGQYVKENGLEATQEFFRRVLERMMLIEDRELPDDLSDVMNTGFPVPLPGEGKKETETSL